MIQLIVKPKLAPKLSYSLEKKNRFYSEFITCYAMVMHSFVLAVWTQSPMPFPGRMNKTKKIKYCSIFYRPIKQ